MMTPYSQIDDLQSPNPPFNRQSFRLRSYTFSSPFNEEILEDRVVRESQRRADVVVLKEILTEYEQGHLFHFILVPRVIVLL